MKQEDLINYRPTYLSLYVKFKSARHDWKYFFYEKNGEVKASINGKDCEWLTSNLHLFVASHDKPVWIINGNSQIYLQEHLFSADEIQDFKENGIDIYLYEPLFTFNIYDEYPYKPSDPGYIKIPELNWIQEFIHRHDIESEVNVYTCDYNIDLKNVENAENFTFNISHRDIFLIWQSEAILKSRKYWSHKFDRRPIEKKAICYNFRYEPVRESIVGLLRSRDYFDECIVSFS